MKSYEFVPKSLLSSSFDVFQGTRRVAHVHREAFRERARFRFGGEVYELRSRGFTGGRIELRCGDRVVASAVRSSIWKSAYAVTSRIEGDERRSLELGTPSAWTSRFEVRDGSRVVGRMQRTRWWSRSATLKLTGDLPVPLAIFLGHIVRLIWARQSAAAASA